MGIQYLNGKRLSQAVIAASQRVLEAQEHLNRINVFPVPDGDTGTNMALTLKAVAETAIQLGSEPLGDLCGQLAESALMNSRGNSGAVLSQFFQGMAEAFGGKTRVSLTGFIKAMEHAVKQAEKAFLEPIEGTILTVMRAWKNRLLELEAHSGFHQVLSEACQAAAEALRATPQKLKVLARAGVVDAGGQGFVHMLEGVLQLIQVGRIEWSFGHLKTVNVDQPQVDEPEDMTYPFCTECLIIGDHLDPDLIRKTAHGHGDSLIVAGRATKVRVHVHTLDPENLFQDLEAFGELSLKRFQDMRIQAKDAKQASRVALVTDSSCDLPMEFLIEQGIHVVPVSVTFGQRTFLDRVDISSDVIYSKMEREEWPTTSQPTPKDFMNAYNLAAQNHDQILAILLSSQLSGTFQAGQIAAKTVQKNHPDLQVRLFDSKATAGALGLLVKIAAEWSGLSPDSMVERLNHIQPQIRIVIMIKTMDYLIHGGRVSRMRGFIAKLLNLVPILSLKSTGAIFPIAKVRPDQARNRLLQHVLDDIRKRKLENLQIIISHARAEQTAQILKEGLLSAHPDAWIAVLPASPTVGTHVGPGACGISYFGHPPGGFPW